MTFSLAISKAASISSLLPVVAMLARLPLRNAQEGLLAALAVFSVIAEISSYVLAWLLKNNLPGLHVYLLVQGALMILIFYSCQKEKFQRLLHLALLAFFIGFVAFNTLFIESVWSFPENARTAENIIMVTLSLLFFYNTLQDLNQPNLLRSFMFWFSAGALVYFAGTLIIFSFGSYIEQQDRLVFQYIWAIHAAFVILMNIAFSIAFLCRTTSTS